MSTFERWCGAASTIAGFVCIFNGWLDPWQRVALLVFGLLFRLSADVRDLKRGRTSWPWP